MTPEVIIADDITGAGDSGVHFAASGRRTALLLEYSALGETLKEHDTVAFSTESRFLSPGDAAEQVRRAVRDCHDLGAGIAFKKIDSTMRGNPGAEIEAILDETGYQAALVCTAMPKTGRTIRNGVMLLHGTPVHETEAGKDPFNPVTVSGVADILGAQTSLKIGHISLETLRSGKDALAEAVAKHMEDGCRILVSDAVEDEDLSALGKLLRVARNPVGQPTLLAAGAGGLAEAFSGPAVPPADLGLRGKMLAVVGSLTSVSLSQIEHAVQTGGFHVLELDMEKAWDNADAEVERLVQEASVNAGRHLLLKNRSLPTTTGGISTADGVRAATVFGRVAREICQAAGCSVVYVTGGSTSVAVMAALGLRSITLQRECMPGVVLSTCSLPGSEIHWIISKAGGFGGPDTISTLAKGILQPDVE